MRDLVPPEVDRLPDVLLVDVDVLRVVPDEPERPLPLFVEDERGWGTLDRVPVLVLRPVVDVVDRLEPLVLVVPVRPVVCRLVVDFVAVERPVLVRPGPVLPVPVVFVGVVPPRPRPVVVVVVVVALAAGTLGSFRCPPTTSRKLVPGRNAGTLVRFTRTASPVRGLRAVRAALARFSKTPKPEMLTFSPFCTRRTMRSRTPSTAAVAVLRSPIRSASASMSSALFIFSPSPETNTAPSAMRRFCACQDRHLRHGKPRSRGSPFCDRGKPRSSGRELALAAGSSASPRP